MFELLVFGGLVIDGTGAPAVRADVGIRAGRVAAVGMLGPAEAAHRIDAGSCLVMPGFVDAHVHAEAAVFEPDTQLALLCQGITTVLLGQDGLSFAPSSSGTRAHLDRYFAAVNGTHPGLDDGRVSVADLLAGYDRRLPVNTAYLVPHGTVRYEVMGADRGHPDPAQLAAMRALVEEGLADGAVGLSSGLEYAPGSAADVAELAHLAEAPARAGLPFVTHLRGYEDRAAGAMAEAVQVARDSGAALHVSHYHGPAGLLSGLLDSALAEGLDVTFDSYPYLRGSSILGMVTLPPWLQSADLDATVRALTDEATRQRLERDWFSGRTELWPRITLSHLPSAGWRWAEGRRLPEVAERVGLTPGQLCCQLLVDTDLGAGCVFGQPSTNSAESVRALLRHDRQLAGSDGIYQGGRPHPRGWGAFARLLGRHVRELGDWTWEGAAVHLAARAAQRFRLPDRGRLIPGQVADLVVLDPESVRDRASYRHPRRLAEGVRHVLVGGRPVLEHGALTPGARLDPPGRALVPA